MFVKIVVQVLLFKFLSCLHLSFNESTPLPIFWCKLNLNELCCEFNNVLLNDTNSHFQPAAENVSAVKKITFNSSSIPVLSEDLCQTFPNLEELHLRKSKLREVRKNSFSFCTQIHSLFLIANQLTELNEGIFDFNLNLERLYLNINFIRYLHPRVFVNLKRLKALHLQDNQLTRFDAVLLESQANLEQLVLHTNDLLELDEKKLLECLPALKKVAFNNNLLPCDRVDEIMRKFNDGGVRVHKDFSFRKRFHPQEELYSELLCLDEISWMAVHYRRVFLTEKDNVFVQNNV